MKKVIDGKVYNTDTADLIGSYDNGMSARDFGHYEEDLYRTKKGAWFLQWEGGPASKYARHIGNERRGDSGITVLTETEARTWCEQHDVDADTIAEQFTVDEA